MLRDKNLIPLSRQHQHALALCVRIERASPIANADLAAWLAEIVREFEAEGKIHFSAEENVLFPAARRFDELISLVDELLCDHAALREAFASAEKRAMSAQDLSKFAQLLSAHIRKEERQLFQRLQGLMTQQQLASLGGQLETALESASQACTLPTHKAEPKT